MHRFLNQENFMLDFNSFLRNSAPWRGVDFWMLNDTLDEEKIRFQLTEMRNKGVAAFIARTYTGLKSDYPGPGFKQKLHFIVACAKELGLKLFLQAGYMPEAVFDLPEKFTAQYVTEKQPGEYTFSTSEYYVNMLDPEAVAFYINVSYEEMWQEFSSEFGKTILSIWVDEPSYSGTGLPWSSNLPAFHRKKWGEEVEIPALFHNTPGSGEKRYRYWNTVIRMLEESYFKQVKEWCTRHDLLFSGHLMGEGNFHANFHRGGAMMPFYRYFDIPGIDLLTADMNFEDSPLNRLGDARVIAPDLYTTPLQCVSAARQAGKEKVLCEMYGVSSENLALRDQLHLFNHFASFGVNCRCVHGFFYSLRGRSKRAYPPHVNYYQPYWEHYKELTDECALNSWFISQGKSASDILVLLPWNTAASLYAKGDMEPDHIPALAELEQKFLDLEVTLSSSALPFDLGDEFIMEDEGRVENGKLTVGQCSYSAVVLPWAAKLAAPTIKLLEKFVLAGGKVFILGDSPFTQGIFLDSKAQLLRELSSFRPFEISSDELSSLSTHYAKEEKTGSEFLFLFNRDCGKSHKITLKKSASLFNSDGTLSKASCAFEVPPGGALRLVFSEEQPTEEPLKTLVAKHLPDSWHLVRQQPNVLLLEFARFKKEDETNWSADFPILAIHEILTAEKYKGQVTLRFEIKTEEAFENLSLVLEDPSAFEISLNGTPVPPVSTGFFAAREFETVALPPLHSGVNTLELRRHFEALEKPAKGVTELFQHLKGVELEVPFLIGNFALRSLQEYTRCPGVVRLNREFSLIPESGEIKTEITAEGYPFYAGSVLLSRKFESRCDTGSFTLRFEHLNTAALKVRLNGKDQAIVYMPPYQCRLTGVRKGENFLELELFSSLRNLLGPSHRSNGEYGRCFGGYGRPNKNWIGAVDDYGREFPQWPFNRSVDTSAWCESFMQVPFGLSGCVIEWENPAEQEF